MTREEIARIIDPTANFVDLLGVRWSRYDIQRRDLAYSKADAILALAQRAPWQPIETAPKDGTKVDLWHPTKGRCVDAFWQRQTSVLYEPSCWSNPLWGRIIGATHWMPLPADPALTSTVRCPPGHELCSSCGRLFKFGETCPRGGCPCGGDV